MNLSDNFTFKGKHSLNHMGLYTQIITRPLFAEPKTVYEDIPGTDGELNFNIKNPMRRMCFKPRIIELECHFAGSTEEKADFNNKITELASWLATGVDSPLLFDDEPEVRYMAHVANLYNIENITDFSGTFPLVFKCQPFKYLPEPIVCGNMGSITYENKGYYTPTVIYVSGVTSDGFKVTDSLSRKSLTVNAPLEYSTAVIDTEKMTVKINDVSVLHKCEGDFFELSPGTGTVSVSGGTGTPLHVELCYNPRFL